MTADAPLDPLHRISGPATAWTRVNIAEGVPGVSTPLNWSWWDDSTERMIRGAYCDMGVLARVDLPDPARVDERTSAIFYGRVALNVDVSRRWADLQPGTSGDALEEHFFGAVRPDAVSHPSRRRYPVVALKTPPRVLLLPRLLRRRYADTMAWWQQMVTPTVLADEAGARARFVEARRRFDAIARPHSVAALIAGPIFQQLAALAGRAGRPDLVMVLLGGHQSVEIDTTSELWDVSRGRLSLPEFLRQRGFQGPQQGEISSATWREDPTPVERLVDTFRGLGDDDDPRAHERRRVAEREAAERAVLATSGGARRLRDRAVLAAIHAYVPARELGKAALVMTLDVGRSAARTIGTALADAGRLDDPDDVFFLTIEELLDPVLPADVTERVDARRAQRDAYRTLTLPESWVGMPTPIEEEPAPDAPVRGIGVSPGVVEGRVRVVLDLTADEVAPDEILVCETTDPSWAAYFLVASGVVIDIGGAMSHGAIVAREVGIPCVINTRTGTRSLRTGDRVRVDGGTGAVTVLERAP